MPDPEEIRGLTAARSWRGALHPRGADGRFIEVGGAVKWLFGGQQHVGDVTDVRASRDGKPMITVRERNGKVSVLKPEQLSEAVKAKAHLPETVTPSPDVPGEQANVRTSVPAKAHLSGDVRATHGLPKASLIPQGEKPDPFDEVKGMSPPAAKKWFDQFDPAEQDRLADATNDIPIQIADIVGPRTQYKGNAKEAIAQRLDEASLDPATGKDRIAPEAKASIHQMVDDLDTELRQVGLTEGNESAQDEGFRKMLLLDAVDALVAQEYEAQGRSLGDHGVRHLASDADYAIKALNTMSDGKTTAHQRAMMMLAAIYHDTGYLTKPSRAFADGGHPHWSSQHYEANVQAKVARVLGADDAAKLGHVIATHADTEMDWTGDPEGSAFRLADNLGLFHHDKLPALAYYVPANTGVLIKLGEQIGKIQQTDLPDDVKATHIALAVDQAKINMRRNLHDSNLPPMVKERIDRSIDEVNPVTPKFLVGMVGGEVGGFSKDGPDTIHISLTRKNASEALGRVLDLGQRQFKKFSETYVGEDFADQILDGPVEFKSGGKTAMVMEMTTPVSPQVKEAARRLYDPTEHNGFTGRPTNRGLTHPDTGYSVGVPGSTLVIPPDIVNDRKRTKALMAAWFDEHSADLNDNSHLNFGAWTEEETGEVYLDLSEVYDSPQQAEAAAKARNEIAIWDIANGAPIPIGGTGGRDTVAVAAAGRGRHGPDREAAVRVPGGLGAVDPGGEGRLLGGSPRHAHPAGGRRGAGTAGGADPMTTTPDELRARVHGMTAAGKWAEALHPRGRDGRFIEIGALVRFLVGGKPHTGKVQGITNDTSKKAMPGDSRIDVIDGSGKSYSIGSSDVLRSVPVKADIESGGAKIHVDPETGHVTRNRMVIGKVVTKGTGTEATDIDGKKLGVFNTQDAAIERLVATDAGSASDDAVTPTHVSPFGGGRADQRAAREAVARLDATPSGTKDDPIITDDVDVAVQALQEGKYVQLNQPDEVATLLDKLAEVANDFKAQGVNAKGKFDLCKITVPKTNIFCAQAMVPDRLHMPQLGGVPTPGTQADSLPKDRDGEVDLSDLFIEHLAGLGIAVTDTQREASHLRASQGQLDGATVAGMMTNASYDPGKKPIFITRDGYVVDGHHRWAAVTGRSYKAGEPLPMNVREIDANILDVLQIANEFATGMGMPQRTMGEGGPAKPAVVPDEVGTESGLLHPAADAAAMALARDRASNFNPGREFLGNLPEGLAAEVGPMVELSQEQVDRIKRARSIANRTPNSIAKEYGIPVETVLDVLTGQYVVAASATPWKRYVAMLASGAIKPDSPFLTSDGLSWNGEAVPDKVRLAITAPMGKITDTTAAEALNALYRTLVLGGGQQVPLDTINQQVDQLETVAAAEGTDSGDASTLQKVSKLVRTIFAIPDQADLDRAQEKANSKAKSLGGPAKKEAAPADEGNEAPAAEAAEPPAHDAAEGEAPASAPAPAAPAAEAVTGAPAPDAATLRQRVHG